MLLAGVVMVSGTSAAERSSDQQSTVAPSTDSPQTPTPDLTQAPTPDLAQAPTPDIAAAAAPGTCTPQPGLPGNAPVLQPGVWTNISPAGVPFGQSPFTFTNAIGVDPCNPAILYTGVNGFDIAPSRAGLYKSVNAGATWNKIGHLDEPVHIRINPRDPQHLLVADGVRGSTMGLWVSRNGGDTWNLTPGWMAAKTGKYIDDVYDVAADPDDFNHILVTFHAAWGWTDTVWNANSGVLESKDGGNTWITHPPVNGWGVGHGIWFINSTTWLLGTQGNGYWRTSDSGQTWQQVTTESMVHGGAQLYRSSTGALYITSWSGVLRSANGTGTSWTIIGGPNGNGLIGDGNSIYGGPYFSREGGKYSSTPENGPVTWTSFNHSVSMGPYEMAFDPVNRIVYAASWEMGVLALKVGGSPAPAAPTGVRISKN
jgi:hypothetical protein